MVDRGVIADVAFVTPELSLQTHTMLPRQALFPNVCLAITKSLRIVPSASGTRVVEWKLIPSLTDYKTISLALLFRSNMAMHNTNSRLLPQLIRFICNVIAVLSYTTVVSVPGDP